MRYFPIGQQIERAAPLGRLEFHPKSTVLSRNPPSMITPPAKWHSAAILPIHLTGHPYFYLEVQLTVKRGRIGIALQREDQTITEQLPAPDRWNNAAVRFFVNTPEDCHNLLFRNWGDRDEPAEFSIERVAVHQAYREITEAQIQRLGPESWVFLDRSWLTYLEFHLLDFCNLSCPFCSHGTSGTTRGNRLTSLEDLRRFSSLVRPHEFDALKIAGGEPTLHPEFREICRGLSGLFPVMRRDLATNGAQLTQFLDATDAFDWIDLSHYPGRNDQIFDRVVDLGLPNVHAFHKEDGLTLFDSSLEPHTNRLFVFENCPCSPAKMVANGRIFDCPGVYGQMIPPKNLSGETSSVRFDENWRSNLAQLDIEELCKRCFWPVDAPRVIGTGSYREQWTLPKRIGQSIYSRNGDILRTPSLTEFQWSPPIEQPYELRYAA